MDRKRSVKLCGPLNRYRVLSSALDLIPDAVFAIDTAGKVILWNRAIEAMTGVSRTAIIGQTDYAHSLLFYGQRRPMLADLVLTPDAHYESRFMNFLRQGESAQGEIFAQALYDGKGAHIWSRASVLYDKRGRRLGAIQTISDITSKVEQHAKLEALNAEYHAANQELAATNEQITAVEEELRQQYEELFTARSNLERAHQQLANIIEYLPDAVFVVDADKKVIAWNRELENITGVSKDKILGTSDYSIALYGERRPVLVDYVGMDEEVVRKQYRTDFRRMEQQVIHNEGFMPNINNGKGAYLSVTAASILDEKGNIIGAVESFRDISSSREKELALRRNEALLREITEHMHDVVLRLSPDGIIEYISPSVKRIAGYTVEQAVGEHLSKFIHADDLAMVMLAINSLASGAEDVSLEFRCYHIDGSTRHAESVASPIRDSDGIITGYVVVVRDVSERKMLEQRLRYLGLHDHLTGIYNRAFFEEQLMQMKHDIFFPLAIVTCDIDGLKLVNDTLGHAAGDALLRTAVSLVKQFLRNEDILARVGGDELAVIVPRTTETSTKQLCASIRASISAYNDLHPELPLSISLGYAFAEAPCPLPHLFEAADTNMYREKLHRQQSTRSSVVHTLMRALEARDFITEGHADRLQSLVVGLAERLGLSERTITDLRLLAQFHDIGKVGVPDRILFKPGRLTPEEQAEMRQHCEIGHRIAQASPDLAPIADWVLKHHEWWNGEGYPLRLKGEDIPLECRILSIADAYDAMTNDRPYRKALCPQVAEAELIRNSGSQFDPYLIEEFLKLLKASGY